VIARRFLIFLLFLALCAAIPISPAFANTGAIKGKVADPDGKPVAGVKVTLVDPSRGQTYVTKTDRKGDYFLMGISPSEYRLKLEKPGFQPLEGRVSIAPGLNSVFDAVLAPVAPPQAVKPELGSANIKANEIYAQGRYEEAAAAYRDILAANPDLAVIHFNLGNCAYNLQRYEEALASFREAVRLKPDFFDAYVNLANAYGKLKEFGEAIPVFEEAIRAYPEIPRLFSSLGLLYLNAGEGAKAVESLEKATALDPREPFSFYSLGIAYTQTAAYAKAVAAYERYIALIEDVREIDRIKGLIVQLKALDKK
jgi:tetratricopeptide (TPR) repeat protein